MSLLDIAVIGFLSLVALIAIAEDKETINGKVVTVGQSVATLTRPRLLGRPAERYRATRCRACFARLSYVALSAWWD